MSKLARRGLLSRGLVASLVLAAGVTGCGSGSNSTGGTTSPASGGTQPVAAKKKIHLAAFLGSAANTYYAANLEGVKDAAREDGNADVSVFDAQFDTAKQKNQLRDALVSGKFDGWFLGANDGNPLVPEFRQAVQKNIKVACTLVPCGPDVNSPEVQVPGLVAQVGESYPANGKALGELAVQACKDKDPCKVFFLPGNPQFPLEKARKAGIDSVIGSHPNIQIVATQAGNYLPAPALTATQNVLQAHPDIDVIMSSGDQMIAGALKAAKKAGLAKHIKMFGTGCTFEAVESIKKGEVFGCVPYVPRTEAKIATEMIIKAIRGEKIEGKSIDPLANSPAGLTVTKENVDQFKPEFHS
jgi:ribose transport system substrate-binding protein